jgi:hypothetical protein
MPWRWQEEWQTLFEHNNCKPYKHVKHFRMQMNLQVHFLYICF